MRMQTCEMMPRLSIYELRRACGLVHGTQLILSWEVNAETFSVHMLTNTCGTMKYIDVCYSYEGKMVRYPIEIDLTRPNFGGTRNWFVCPLEINGIPCGRRVGILYLGGKYFGCRTCYRLAYRSTQRTHSGRFVPLYHLSRYIALQQRLEGLRTKYFKGIPTKRHRRYMRKQDLLDALIG